MSVGVDVALEALSQLSAAVPEVPRGQVNLHHLTEVVRLGFLEMQLERDSALERVRDFDRRVEGARVDAAAYAEARLSAALDLHLRQQRLKDEAIASLQLRLDQAKALARTLTEGALETALRELVTESKVQGQHSIALQRAERLLG